MIASRDIIAVTRQLGSMMEAGVDILRAIRVLRAQTEDAEWLALYDRLVHDLRLGSGLADAMSRAPEVFSPFAISLLRQGEARGDLAGSFYRIADYLQKEQEIDTPPAAAPTTIQLAAPSSSTQECPVWLRQATAGFVTVLGGFLVLLFLLELLVVTGYVPPRWHGAAALALAWVFCLVMAWRLRRDIRGFSTPESGSPESVSEEASKSTFEESGTEPDEATFE